MTAPLAVPSIAPAAAAARPRRRRLAPRLNSISTRLALWYAAAATATLAGLFVSGYFALEHHIVGGLDLLNLAELGEVKAHLVRDYAPDDPTFLARRLSKPSERSGALFYLDLRNDQNGLVFYSANLKGKPLAATAAKGNFDIEQPGIGKLRVGRYRIAPYTITIGTSSRDVDRTLEGYGEIALSLLGCMMVASLGIGFGLSRMALKPVRTIRDTANRIGSDNLGERIKVGAARDEIAELSTMLNQMFDRLESAFTQIRQFSAEASHELKTPLSLVRLHAERMLLSGRLEPAHEEAVQLQLEELARLDQIIEEMLFLSRVEARAISLKLTHANPAAFLHAFGQDARVLAESTGHRFAHTHDGEGKVAFDQKRIRQVLLNLLGNAIKAAPPGSSIALRSLLDNGCWRISVEDEGPGVPPDQYERIFERFVRLSQGGGDDQGNGLGLAICRGIVGMHRGRIHAGPGAGGAGLRVVVEIPAM
jgi:two-component system heavy metal sensor histidine kinase CusS